MAEDLNDNFEKAQVPVTPANIPAPAPARKQMPWENVGTDDDSDEDGSGPGYESAYPRESFKYDGVK